MSSTQATQGSAGSGPAPNYPSSTQTSMNRYLYSTEGPINAQMVGSAGIVNSIPHATKRASQDIQNVDSKVPSNGHASYANYSAGR